MKDFVKQPDFGQMPGAWPKTPAPRARPTLNPTPDTPDMSEAGMDPDARSGKGPSPELRQQVWREVDRQMRRQSMILSPGELIEPGPPASAGRLSSAKTFAEVMQEAQAKKSDA